MSVFVVFLLFGTAEAGTAVDAFECGSGAIVLRNFSGITTGSTAALGPQDIPSCGVVYSGSNVQWFAFEGGGVPLTIDTCGSSFDTQLMVFSAASRDGQCSICENFNEDGCTAYTSALTMVPNPGQWYFVSLTGYAAESGDYVLTLTGGCNAAGCADCRGDAAQCVTCSRGLYLDSLECLPCAPNCDNCTSGLSTACVDCSVSFGLSGGICEPCSSGCSDCLEGVCSDCHDGYWLSSGSCTNCSSQCALCDSAGCTRCIAGYVVTLEGTCAESCPVGVNISGICSVGYLQADLEALIAAAMPNGTVTLSSGIYFLDGVVLPDEANLQFVGAPSGTMFKRRACRGPGFSLARYNTGSFSFSGIDFEDLACHEEDDRSNFHSAFTSKAGDVELLFTECAWRNNRKERNPGLNIRVESNDCPGLTTSGNTTLRACLFSGNDGIGMTGGRFLEEFSLGHAAGAAIFESSYYDRPTNVLLDGCRFLDNRGIYAGAFKSDGTTVNMQHTTFERNYAISMGGAIMRRHRYFTEIYSVHNCSFVDNKATFGGAISVGDLDVDTTSGCEGTYTSCTFVGNEARHAPEFEREWSLKAQGAAVFLQFNKVGGVSNLTFTDCVFSHNESPYSVLSLYGAVVDMSNTNFTYNTAVNGATIYGDFAGSFQSCTFEHGPGVSGNHLHMKRAVALTFEREFLIYPYRFVDTHFTGGSTTALVFKDFDPKSFAVTAEFIDSSFSDISAENDLCGGLSGRGFSASFVRTSFTNITVKDAPGMGAAFNLVDYGVNIVVLDSCTFSRVGPRAFRCERLFAPEPTYLPTCADFIGSIDIFAAYPCCMSSSYGVRMTEDTCELCPLGMYAEADTMVQRYRRCVPCPPGTIGVVAGGFTSASCLSCPPRAVSSKGSLTCSLCEPGTAPSALGDECEKCAPGFYATSTDNACMPCPPGTLSAPGAVSSADCILCSRVISDGRCVACAPGQQAVLGRCELCPPGTASVDGVAGCSPCEVGQLASADGICEYCPAGTYLSESENACQPCNDTSVSSPGSLQCTHCEEGTYRRPERDMCVPCPPGTVGTSARTCHVCVQSEEACSSLLAATFAPASLAPAEEEGVDLTSKAMLAICMLVFFVVYLLVSVVLAVLFRRGSTWIRRLAVGDVFYSLHHHTPWSSSPVKRRTLTGAFVTGLLLLSTLTMVVVQLLDYFEGNLFMTEVQVAGLVSPALLPSLRVQLAFIGPATCVLPTGECDPLLRLSHPVRGSVEVTCQREADNFCTVTWGCSECQLTENPGSFVAEFADSSAFVVRARWTVQEKKQQDVGEMVPSSPRRLFHSRTAVASVKTISLRQVAETNVKGETAVFYTLNPLSFVAAEVDIDDYDPAGAGGVEFQIALFMESTSIQRVTSQRQSFAGAVAQSLGAAVGLLGASRALLMMVETGVRAACPHKEAAQEEMYNVDDPADVALDDVARFGKI